MRALLTGASGFLGANCLRHLLDHTDWDIVCPVSFSHRGVPERISLTVIGEEWRRVTVVVCELATPVADTTAALFGDIDIIINFASESHIPRSVADPVAFMGNNVNLMMHLLEYARTLPDLTALVQISTDEVYGPCPSGGHAEWSPVIPSTPYSASKAAQEAMAVSYWRTFGLPLVLINTMNPLGPMQDPEKFVPMVISRVRRGELVTIHVGPDGQPGSRVYVHAADLSAAILHVLRHPLAVHGESDRPDRYNVVGLRDVDNLELAEMIAQRAGQPLRYALQPSERGVRFALDGSKLAAAGWKPGRSIEDTVAELVAWAAEHPLWSNRKPRP